MFSGADACVEAIALGLLEVFLVAIGVGVGSVTVAFEGGDDEVAAI